MQLGRLSLALERAEPGAGLALDVEHPRDVVLGPLELELRAPAALAVLAKPGGLLDQQAAVARLGVDDRLDAALRDDRVHLAAEPRVGQHLEHVDESASRAVQPVLALAVAVQAARDRDLREAARERALRIVQYDVHLGPIARRDPVAAREDHVLHGLPAHGERALLAERPEHAVGDVRLPGAVGADDHRHARREVEPGAVGERLEPLEHDPLEMHQRVPGSGGQSSSMRSSACEAASCSAAFLVFPSPRPISSPDTSATATKLRSWAGPRASTMR